MKAHIIRRPIRYTKGALGVVVNSQPKPIAPDATSWWVGKTRAELAQATQTRFSREEHKAP